jgi:hypothetical protein
MMAAQAAINDAISNKEYLIFIQINKLNTKNHKILNNKCNFYLRNRKINFPSQATISMVLNSSM